MRVPFKPTPTCTVWVCRTDASVFSLYHPSSGLVQETGCWIFLFYASAPWMRKWNSAVFAIQILEIEGLGCLPWKATEFLFSHKVHSPKMKRGFLGMWRCLEVKPQVCLRHQWIQPRLVSPVSKSEPVTLRADFFWLFFLAKFYSSYFLFYYRNTEISPFSKSELVTLRAFFLFFTKVLHLILFYCIIWNTEIDDFVVS